MSLFGRVARVLTVVSTLAFAAWLAMPGASQAAQAKGKVKTPVYYVSLGDSYSVGYQPTPSEATPGYTAYVAKKKKMTLENFGCGGATTLSILTYTGICGTGGTYGPPAATDAGPVIPGDTQVQNALAFISEHQTQIGLVTVSIGGNDVTSCATEPTLVLIIGCVEAADTAITANVTTLARELRTAVGSGVPIVGLTYPDVILGSWVYPTYSPTNNLASASIAAFDSLINPTLCSAYTGSPQDGSFVNVTAASVFGGAGVTGSEPCPSGSITSLSTLAKLPKSTGVTDVPNKTEIPEAVVDICKTTYYCTLGNIHANSKGYLEIGKLIVSALEG